VAFFCEVASLGAVEATAARFICALAVTESRPDEALQAQSKVPKASEMAMRLRGILTVGMVIEFVPEGCKRSNRRGNWHSHWRYKPSYRIAWLLQWLLLMRH
jgi:hypothetical protein